MKKNHFAAALLFAILAFSANAQNTRRASVYSCGGFNTPTLCVEIKGIESDCNTL